MAALRAGSKCSSRRSGTARRPTFAQHLLYEAAHPSKMCPFPVDPIAGATQEKCLVAGLYPWGEFVGNLFL